MAIDRDGGCKKGDGKPRKRKIHTRPGVSYVIRTKKRSVIVIPPDAEWRKE